MISPNIETTGSSAKTEPYDPKRFDWPLAYPAEEFLNERIATFLANNSFARQLAGRMRDETATDFFEWIDHLVLSPSDETALREVGFTDDDVEAPRGDKVLHHPRATLPRVILRAGQKQNPSAIALRPEFVADFIARNNLAAEIEGTPFSQYRRAVVNQENERVLKRWNVAHIVALSPRR